MSTSRKVRGRLAAAITARCRVFDSRATAEAALLQLAWGLAREAAVVVAGDVMGDLIGGSKPRRSFSRAFRFPGKFHLFSFE